MPAAALARSPAELLELKRARGREAWHRWREKHRPKAQRLRDHLGPPIAAGRPFVDDFEKTEAKWSKLMAGERFVNEPNPRF